jgi:hypothetical protein
MPNADVVDISSSDTEALLDSLFMSPACGSPVLRPCTSSDCDSFEDWPDSNDMVVSVYVVLCMDASSSCMPTVSAPRDAQESCSGDPPARELRSQVASMTINAERALEMPMPRGGSLSATGFDKSEWEIMYPLFVVEGPIDPSERVNRGSS